MTVVNSVKNVGKGLAVGGFTVLMAPVTVVAALGSLAVMGYRGAKITSNLKSAFNEATSDEESSYFVYGEKLLMPLKSTYNFYSDVIKQITGKDMGQLTPYNPHPLDPTQDLVEDFELKTGWFKAEKIVIDFINSGGMKYDINISSYDSLKLYDDTRKTFIDDLLAKTPNNSNGVNSNLTSELKDAKDELDAFKSYFDNQIIKESNINPSRYHKHLTELHVTITKALEKQFKADKTTIDSLYTSNPALLPPKADIETKLKESHDNQLKEFEKKMEEDKKQLLEATNRESHRISFLAYVYKHNPAMKDTFDTLAQNAANNRTAGSGTNPVLSAAIVGGLKISFKGIDPKDLPDFKAFGATIASVKDDKGKITGYTMELPWRIWPGNIVGLEDKTKHRIVMLVKAIKASSGRDKIKMEVSHPDPVHAMYLARKMFEACRDEGYDEKNITIVCNKKTIPIHDTAKGKDKDGNETVEEKGLLKNEIAKAAIDTRAAAHQEARNANNKRLKDEIARNRPANTEKSVTEEIHDAAAARNGTTTIP